MCSNLDPDIIQVIIEHKTDLLFSKQLLMNRSEKRYIHTFEKVNQLTSEAFMDVWVKSMNFHNQTLKAEKLYQFSLENFYSQITEENLQFSWLQQYFKNLQQIIGSIN